MISRLSRLAIRLPPINGELVISYVNRLATIHGLPYDELWRHVSIVPKKGYYHQLRQPHAHLLAQVTGRPPE